MFLKEGTTVALSEWGGRGFIYPSSKTAITKKDAEITPLNFMTFRGMNAYFIPEGAIFDDPQFGRKIIIWVKDDQCGPQD
jgi:hypothetical protein